MYESDYPRRVVIDNGSFEIKSGFAGDDEPTIILSNVVGNLINQTNINDFTKKEYIGNEAQKNREILNLNYPIQRGIVEDWDNMETIWNYLFTSQLKIDPKNCLFLMTYPQFNPKSSKEKTTQIMFETFDISAFYMHNAQILSLYSSGRTTGIVVDIGHGTTAIQPIYEGYEISHAIDRYNISGVDLTQYLIKLLEEKGYSFTTSSEIEMAREIKQRFCYCSTNYQEEIKQNENQFHLEKEYESKNGDIISISEERIKCCESLFDPRIIGIDLDGIHKLIYKSIMESDIDTRKDLFQNIVLSGGTTLFPNFEERLQKEIKLLVGNNTKVNVTAPPERKISVWIGGSIFGSLGLFQPWWISKEEYEEFGPSVIDRK